EIRGVGWGDGRQRQCVGEGGRAAVRRGGTMKPTRIQPKPVINTLRLGVPEGGGQETARADGSLKWVTARLPGDLVHEIEAHAKRMGATRSDAIRDCLGLGIETIRSRDGIPPGPPADLPPAPPRP